MHVNKDSQESDIEDNPQFSQISTRQVENNSDICSELYFTYSDKSNILNNQFNSELICSQHKLPIEYIVLCTNYMYHYQNCCRKCFINQQPNINTIYRLDHHKICKFCNQVHHICSPKSCNIFTMHFEIEELILDYTASFKQLIKAFDKSLQLIKNVLLQINYNSLKRDCLLSFQKLYNNLKNSCIEHMTLMGIDAKQFCKYLQSTSGQFNFQRNAITFDSIHRCMNFLLNEQKQWEDQERQIERFINNQFDGYQNVRKKYMNEEHAFYFKEDSTKFSQNLDSQPKEICLSQKKVENVDEDEDSMTKNNTENKINHSCYQTAIQKNMNDEHIFYLKEDLEKLSQNLDSQTKDICLKEVNVFGEENYITTQNKMSSFFQRVSNAPNFNSRIQGMNGGCRRYRGDDNSLNILDNPLLTQKCSVKDVLLIQNSYEMHFNKYSNPLLYDYSFSDIFHTNFFSFINQNPINWNKKCFHQEEFTPKEASLIHDLHQQIKLLFLERYDRLNSSLIAQTKASFQQSELTESYMTSADYDQVYNENMNDNLQTTNKNNYQSFLNLGDSEQSIKQNPNKINTQIFNDQMKVLNNQKINSSFQGENTDLNSSLNMQCRFVQNQNQSSFSIQSNNENPLKNLNQSEILLQTGQQSRQLTPKNSKNQDNFSSIRQNELYFSDKPSDQIFKQEKVQLTMNNFNSENFEQKLQQNSFCQKSINSSKEEEEEEEYLGFQSNRISSIIKNDQSDTYCNQQIENNQIIEKNKNQNSFAFSQELGYGEDDDITQEKCKQQLNFCDNQQQLIKLSKLSSDEKNSGYLDKFSKNSNSFQSSNSNCQSDDQLNYITDYNDLNKNKKKNKQQFSLAELSCKTCDDVQQVQQGKFFKCGNVSYFDFNERYGFFYSMTDTCSMYLFDFEKKRVVQQILSKEISQKEHNQIIIVKVSSTEIAVWQEERFYEIIIFNVYTQKFYKFRFAGIDNFQVDESGQNEAEINVFSIFQGSTIGIQLNNRLFKINYKKRKVIRIYQLQISKQPSNFPFLHYVSSNRLHLAAQESPIRSMHNQSTQTNNSYFSSQNNNQHNSEQIQIIINGQQQQSYNNSQNYSSMNNQSHLLNISLQQSIQNNNNNHNNNYVVPWTITSNSVESNENNDIGQQNNINSFESEFEPEDVVEQFEDFKVVLNRKSNVFDLEKCSHFNTQPDNDCSICQRNVQKLQVPRYCLYMRSDQSIWQMNLHNGQMNEWLQNDNSQVVQQRFFPINENKWFYYKDTVDEQWIIVYNNQVQQGEYLQLKMMEFDRPILNKYWPLLNQENELVFFDYKAEQFHTRIFDPADLVQQYIKKQIDQSNDEGKFEEYDKIDNYAFVKTFGKYLVFILSEGDIYYIK
ncbi:hypothetical protein TTHERM_00266430 (macronuclear) [Tetrahymena thermophila SB210]|uniref:Uncharacterized protein n=1 Tax=Tetrahymena thermophila (strain SB210) TaxID=312017 RepID=I7M7Q2_TETTS|nr:hypothetical protein TTHERM_00266430 [Tetrahymena thermophila SB210]EAR95633.2 hypothetical protein TTHERM_00266430 [Tetrahymena thermophila SB210]|eukprot:XP_001015878.2 hypothetical protein TTHERM_00266430 [Tetrahymena thermophila SB210]